MSVFKYSTTAESNSTVGDGADAESIAEGMPRNKVNDAMRAIAADLANYDADKSGVTTGGSATEYTLTSNSAVASLTDGLTLSAKMHITSGAEPTLNLNGIGAKPIKIRGATGALSAAPAGGFTTGDTAQLSFSVSDDAWVAPYLNQSSAPKSANCRLTYTDATTITLAPHNGASVPIAGVSYPIPSAGLPLPNTGLVADTTYYVIAHVVSCAPELLAVAQVATDGSDHEPDDTAGNIGVEVMANNSAYTLVGMVRTNASSEFSEGMVATWFNRKRRIATVTESGSISTASTSYASIGTELEFLHWGDGAVSASFSGYMASDGVRFGAGRILFDGSNVAGHMGNSTSASGYSYNAAIASTIDITSEGRHTAVFQARTSAGTITVSGYLTNPTTSIVYWS